MNCKVDRKLAKLLTTSSDGFIRSISSFLLYFQIRTNPSYVCGV